MIPTTNSHQPFYRSYKPWRIILADAAAFVRQQFGADKMAWLVLEPGDMTRYEIVLGMYGAGSVVGISLTGGNIMKTHIGKMTMPFDADNRCNPVTAALMADILNVALDVQPQGFYPEAMGFRDEYFAEHAANAEPAIGPPYFMQWKAKQAADYREAEGRG